MGSQKLVLVYEIEALDAADVIARIGATLARIGVASEEFLLYGKPMRLEQARTRILRTRRPSFLLTGAGFEFHLSRITNYLMDTLEIRGDDGPTIPWLEFVSTFLTPKLVMGWLADTEYDFWQNAEDPLHYKSHGKRSDHLPKKSNGLPPPLAQVVIDVSGNPGKRVLRAGYWQAVGATMWLGEQFFLLAGANRRAINETTWLRKTEIGAGVLQIEASDECFRLAEGTQAETQWALRRLLYPTDT